MLQDVRELLIPKLPHDAIGVAGVPRSGMIPASYIAALMHLPLYEMSPRGELRPMSHGYRGRAYGWASSHAGRMIVVEDTTYTGRSVQLIRDARPGTSDFYACVYAREGERSSADAFARQVSAPRFFEWHYFNSGHMDGRVSYTGLKRGAALDMDGIICVNPWCRDSSLEYETWMRTTRPIWLPRSTPCRAIVTGRLDMFRETTERWLAHYGVKYDKLYMHPAGTFRERGDWRSIAQWKVECLREIGCSAYVESEWRSAQLIHGLWGGWVVCPPENRVIPARNAVDSLVNSLH